MAFVSSLHELKWLRSYLAWTYLLACFYPSMGVHGVELSKQWVWGCFVQVCRMYHKEFALLCMGLSFA